MCRLSIVTFVLLHQVYDLNTTDAIGQAQWPEFLAYLHASFPDYKNNVHREDRLKRHRLHEERLRVHKCPISYIRDWQTRMRELFLPIEELPAYRHTISQFD